MASSSAKRPWQAAGKIRVLLADDHSIVRAGLHQVLQAEPDIAVIGEAVNGQDVLRLAGKLQPDVVVMDVSMPRLNGIDATRRIVADLPLVHVIGLSMFEDADLADAMRAAGAVAYLCKTRPAREVVAAIRACVGRVQPKPAAQRDRMRLRSRRSWY